MMVLCHAIAVSMRLKAVFTVWRGSGCDGQLVVWAGTMDSS